MTNDSDSDKPANNAEQHSPSPSERPIPTPKRGKVGAKIENGTNEQPTVAREMRREFRWFEFASLFINGALVIVGIYALYIYSGQLKVMRGQLGEIIKQSPELQKSANAAKSAADTADAALGLQGKLVRYDRHIAARIRVKNFGIYHEGSRIQASVVLQNAGELDAENIKYVVNLDFSDARPQQRDFIENEFTKLPVILHAKNPETGSVFAFKNVTNARGMNAYAWGEVRYTDFLGDLPALPFCYVAPLAQVIGLPNHSVGGASADWRQCNQP